MKFGCKPKFMPAMNSETDDYGEMDLSLQSYLNEGFSFQTTCPIEVVHEILIHSLNRFHPTCSTLKIFSPGNYCFRMKNLELQIKCLNDFHNTQKILLSTIVHKVRYNELDPRQRRLRGGTPYKLLAAMMRLNAQLEQSGNTGQVGALDGRFIYF
jgi:hypothetical protein